MGNSGRHQTALNGRPSAAGISEVLGNELTTLWEADGAIKKREERRRDKWASGWI